MKKELFVFLIEYIISEEERADDLSLALKAYTGDTQFTGFFKDTTSLTAAMSSALGDEDGEYGTLIDWWLYDCPKRGLGDKKSRTITTPDKEWDIRTPGDLYDYITREVQ